MHTATSLTLVLSLLAASAAPSVAHAGSQPDPVHSAYCVAALKTRAEPISKRVQGGSDPRAEAQLHPIVTASFAFIGTAYKQGVSGERADELLKAAQKSQAAMPPAELNKVQDACEVEGQALFKQANAFERQFVKRAADSRIERLRKKGS
jgi:hypothetical protein